MIQLENVSKIYHTKYGNIKALDKVNLYVNKGEFVVIRGPSGCGKTTLLLSIGGMLKPTEGKIFISGKNIYDVN
ncbi:ABC transporter ATP-binding protein, partial [candidate division KSB1 bacterium]